MPATVSVHKLANILSAAVAHWEQALMLWCVFGLCVKNVILNVILTVVEEEEVSGLLLISQQHDLGQH